MGLRLNIVRKLDVTVMEFNGRVTLGEGSVVYRNAVREAIWAGQRKLALDYGDITYQDSSGNGEMVSAYTTVANSGGQLVIFDVTKRVSDMFQVTRLYKIFPVFDSLKSALAHFDSIRSPEITVSARRFFHVSVITIQGLLTEKFGASRVTASIQSAVDSGAESVILLFPQVLDIDRAAADSLIAARRIVQFHSGELVLAGVEQRLLPAVSDAGLLINVPMYETVDAALGAFKLTVDHQNFEVSRAR